MVLTAAFPAAAGADDDLSWLNGRRAAAGLAPLVEDGGLDQLALRHTQAMIAQSTLAHTPNLGAAFSAVRPDWVRAGENVGVGPSMASVDAAFMASSEHRANILGAYRLAGTAVLQGSDGRIWITQEFADVARAPSPAPARRTPPPAATRRAPSGQTGVGAGPSPDSPAPRAGGAGGAGHVA